MAINGLKFGVSKIQISSLASFPFLPCCYQTTTYSDTKLQMLKMKINFNAMTMQARYINKFSETIISEVIKVGILVTFLMYQNRRYILIYYNSM